MLSTITILTALAFAAIYPLCFMISADNPLKDNFHKFHLGLPNTVGGVAMVFIWLMDVPISLKVIVTIWKIVFFTVSRYSWKKAYPNPKLVLLPCLLGMYAFVQVQANLIGSGWTIAFIGILSGSIFCCALYTMNLGHWYLNVHGLPVVHLMRSINIFWILLGIRILWDTYFLICEKVLFDGELITIISFMMRIDGFLLVIGLFFGTVFPFISLYFVREVLKLKNTQSATGILYVILCSILIGDIAYKYYLIKFFITL